MLPDTEKLRLSYKPSRVRLLLVGESAPAAGTFFYRGDSLCQYTQKAFSEFFNEVEDLPAADFLKWFSSQDCYLDDLCLVPVNGMEDESRERQRAISVPSLANRIRLYRPEVIVTVMKGIRGHTQLATIQSGLDDVQSWAIPFAANGNQTRYIQELALIIEQLKGKRFFEKDRSEYCFAYGSNMDRAQMNERCPESTFEGIGVVNNHQLGFTYRSNKRKCGVADIIPATDEKVFGVVYKLTASDWSRLNRCEGRGTAYERRPYKIHINQGNRIIEADAYYVLNPEEFVPPSNEYLQLILNAARNFEFPESYIRRIQETHTEN